LVGPQPPRPRRGKRKVIGSPSIKNGFCPGLERKGGKGRRMAQTKAAGKKEGERKRVCDPALPKKTTENHFRRRERRKEGVGTQRDALQGEGGKERRIGG